jgi:hypothetical protein
MALEGITGEIKIKKNVNRFMLKILIPKTENDFSI